MLKVAAYGDGGILMCKIVAVLREHGMRIASFDEIA